MSDTQPAQPTETAVQLTVNGQYVKDLSFEVPNAPAIFSELSKAAPEIPIGIDIEAQQIGERSFEVVLKINIEAKVSGKAAFIVASKRHPDSVDRRPLKRRMLTWGINAVLNAVTGYPGSDTHGLKSIEGPLAKRLCELSVTTDEVLQTEIVLLAWRLGTEIHELPIQIEERRATSVSLPKRLPKVIGMVSELRRSLRRFPNRRPWRSGAGDPVAPGPAAGGTGQRSSRWGSDGDPPVSGGTPTP